MQLASEFKIARFWTRFAAFYLNLFTVFATTALVDLIVINFHLKQFELWSYDFFVFNFKIFLVVIIIDSIIQGIFAVNISKGLLGLRLYDSKYNSPIGLIRSLLRTIFSFFSIAFFGLGYWAIAFNLDSKSLHDLLSSSKVVKTNQGLVMRILSILLQIFSILLGLVITATLVAALIFLPYTLAKSFYSMNNYASLSSELLEKRLRREINIPISNNRIVALIESKNIDYVEFELNDCQQDSYISKTSLVKLGLSLLDYSFIMEELDIKKIKPSVILPVINLKDINNQDLKIENQRFIITEDCDQIGSDLLETWNYKIASDKSLLSLKLYPGDIAILASKDLDKKSKDYLVHVLRRVRLAWDNYLRFLPVDELKQLISQKQLLSNEISFNFDTNSGYIDHITLEAPSKSEEFNQLCHRFFEQLERFRLVPDELRHKKSTTLSLILEYKEVI